MSTCTFKNKDECGYGLYCLYDSSGLSKCLCSNERYWNTETNYCEEKILRSASIFDKFEYLRLEKMILDLVSTSSIFCVHNRP
ncbi:hypothetical protein BpHYR1_035821 [Brachionus plicatilis]|uniref:Uncharacterized protein n=1 Tax=Brachionus plicatilis TaxID=10195 RepID=A0A3M7SFU5_BRAPC|nr:hypothetical protein BpHYR1_035821 [Brachionus plicatilis]